MRRLRSLDESDGFLRFLLVVVLVALIVACGLLLIITLDLAAASPRVAALQVPIAVAGLIGLAPVLAGVGVLFRLMTLIDQGEAWAIRFSMLDRLCTALDCQPCELIEYLPAESRLKPRPMKGRI